VFINKEFLCAFVSQASKLYAPKLTSARHQVKSVPIKLIYSLNVRLEIPSFTQFANKLLMKTSAELQAGRRDGKFRSSLVCLLAAINLLMKARNFPHRKRKQ